MSWLARLGLAVARPRDALALAGDRAHAGRAGTDLVLALLAVLAIGQARALVSAVWLALAIEPALGARALVRALTDAVSVPLGFLVIGALVIWASAGARRDLARASDLACVAVVPILVVELCSTIVVQGLSLDLTAALVAGMSVAAYAWAGAVVAFAILEARRAIGQPSARAPMDAAPGARIAGWSLALVATSGMALQAVWLVGHVERVRPVVAGDLAPGFALPRIDAGGRPGARLALEELRGTVVVVDFWATWCKPCLAALPRLDAFARRHPRDVAIVTINLDDPAAARALFDEQRYSLTLLAADAEVPDRYDVATIPHTVVIDRAGRVRRVARGGAVDLERELAAAR